MSEKNSLSSAKLVVACVVSLIVGGGVVRMSTGWFDSRADETVESEDGHGHEEGSEHGENEVADVVQFPAALWESARLKIEPVARQTLTPQTWATGKATLNEDRTAHIFSITEGRAHEVLVSLGDRVQAGQLLAIIDSREVGTAKLELLQARLQQDLAQRQNDFAQEVKRNATQLIERLDSGKTFAEITQELKNKPIGKYREQLLGAYTQFVRAKADVDRLRPIASSGAVAGKQLIQAEAAYNAAKSTFDAVLEQLRFTVPQDALASQQQLRQAAQSVDVAKARLNILGYSGEILSAERSPEIGEELSHYEVRSPFAGTVIDKKVVLEERVGTDTEMFRVADLSTVWIQADIYQKDLVALERLGDMLRFRAPTGSDGSIHMHEANIFYRGDVIDPNTRTLRLRAKADNGDRHIKPGMFVEIEIPTEESLEVLAIPHSAIQEMEGESLVFVQVAEEDFRPTPVTLGESANGLVQIRQGLNEGDRVVTSGAFALKSEIMKGSISHGH